MPMGQSINGASNDRLRLGGSAGQSRVHGTVLIFRKLPKNMAIDDVPFQKWGIHWGSPGICFWKETDIQVHETLPILDTLQKTCFFVDIAVEIAKLKD